MTKKLLTVGAFLLLALILGVSAAAAQEKTWVISSVQGGFSFTVPTTWPYYAPTIGGFSDVVEFGDSADAIAEMDAIIAGKAAAAQAVGIAGFIGQIDITQLQVPAGTALLDLSVVLNRKMVTGLTGIALDKLPDLKRARYGGIYDGPIITLDNGYIGEIVTDTGIFTVVILSDNFAANQAAMLALVDSFRSPPQQTTAATETVSEATPEATTESGRPLPTIIDNDFAMTLKGPWSVIDRVAGDQVLAYGDSNDAALSRLTLVKPGMPDEKQVSPVTGVGGFVLVYAAADLKVDPANPDLSGIMAQQLASLEKQGYVVEQAAQPLPGTPGALYAIVSGTEHGYIALIPYGSKIAYATATDAAGTFADHQDALLAILKSIHQTSKEDLDALMGPINPLTSPNVPPVPTPDVTAEASA